MSEENKQTELQFLVSLLLNHKHKPEVQKKIIERIGEAEKTINQIPLAPRAVPVPVQITPPSHILPPRIIGGDIDNGDGTKSKRKF